MKSYPIVLAVSVLILSGSCSRNGGVKETDNGVNVEIGPYGAARKVGIKVVDEKTIKISAFFSSVPEADENEKESDGIPFDLTVTETSAEIQTLTEGVKINKGTAEISFLDSLGNTLLDIIPHSMNVHSPELRNSMPEDFKIIFSQNDVLSVVSTPSTESDDTVPFIATDGYNILWRTLRDGSMEEYYLIYGEDINFYLHKNYPKVP